MMRNYADPGHGPESYPLFLFASMGIVLHVPKCIIPLTEGGTRVTRIKFCAYSILL